MVPLWNHYLWPSAVDGPVVVAGHEVIKFAREGALALYQGWLFNDIYAYTVIKAPEIAPSAVWLHLAVSKRVVMPVFTPKYPLLLRESRGTHGPVASYVTGAFTHSPRITESVSTYAFYSCHTIQRLVRLQ